ncbi:hypothetical protein [Nocardia cyriacigeorgica]|uniref:hypothetical protein n=1 Tax=Nocardia cyriacigeorgica TaxID=135487 RepID=UPI001895AE33|nr:hypothetical protein [Nocardia cyriacigeorgica]MBF6438391.1 hypothetical protein [Nocardia cyriacigeorgica]
MSVGTVTQWHNDKGWGVIDSPDTAGGCWFHYYACRATDVRPRREPPHWTVRIHPAR